MVTILRKIGFITMMLTMLSCNSWLEVDPEKEASEEKMYANTKGYYSVLNGLYLEMGKSELYGRHLTWGAMDAWGRVYALNENEDSHKGFIAIRDFNYEVEEVKKYASSIWERGYKVIARANNLIKNIERRDSSFFDHGEVEKNVLLGEALAIRAFMHFDLVRVFAQAPVVDANGKYIPYVTVYPSVLNDLLPTSEVLDLVIQDLKLSKLLLATYDTLPRNVSFLTQVEKRFSKTEKPEWGTFYAFRGVRLNYYAVTGALARVYLYAGKYELALEQATEITRLVEDKKLSMTSGNQISLDPKMMDGVLFALYYNNLIEGYETFCSGASSTLYMEDEALFPSDNKQEDYDERWHLLKNGMLTKYMEGKGNTYGEYVPILRLSEMFYIAGECYMTLGGEENRTRAITMLELVREVRGGKTLSASLTKDAFMDKLVNDARKDLAGEGQLLFLFKRLNKMYYSGGSKYDPNGKLILPKPMSESAI